MRLAGHGSRGDGLLNVTAPYSCRALCRYYIFRMIVISFFIGAEAEVDDFAVTGARGLGGFDSLGILSGSGFVSGLAAGKVEEFGIILEPALFLQLIERRVPCLYRVEKCLSTVVVAFCLCELDLFVRLRV